MIPATSFDPSRRLDFYFRVRRDGTRKLVFVDGDGAAIDISLFEFAFYVWKYAEDTSYAIELTIGSGLTVGGAGNNELTITLTEANTNINPGEYYCELFKGLTNKTYLNGKAIAHNGKFDGVSNDTTSITIADGTNDITIQITESGGGSVTSAAIISALGYTPASQAYADAKVADAINDGTTTVAPSQNAVYDAFALRPKIFNVKSYGAVGDGSTDNTTAFQNAINAAIAAGGGTVFIPWASNTYKVSGALQTSVNSVNPNCQIYIPLVTVSAAMITIEIVGETRPNFSTAGVTTVARNTNGVIIESTIQGTGTNPAVFGSPWTTQIITGDKNFVTVKMHNLIIRTSTKSGSTDIAGTMTAINFERLTQFIMGDIKVDISSKLAESIVPTGTSTKGIMMPTSGNKVELSGGTVFIEGYAVGIELGEHTTIDHLIIVGCVRGINMNAGGSAPCRINHYTPELCRNEIVIEGNMYLSIGVYDTEHYVLADKWYQHTGKDVRQVTSHVGFVTIEHSSTGQTNVGYVNDFQADTGARYKVFYGSGQNDRESVVEDNFSRSDAASDPGTGWSVVSGTWGILNGQLRITSGLSTSGATTKLQIVRGGGIGIYKYLIRCDIDIAASNSAAGIMFRYQDSNNFLHVGLQTTGVNLYKQVAGTNTVLTSSATAFATGKHQVKIYANGTGIQVFIDGVSYLTSTDTTFATNTGFGFITYSGTGLGGQTDFDNLVITLL